MSELIHEALAPFKPKSKITTALLAVQKELLEMGVPKNVGPKSGKAQWKSHGIEDAMRAVGPLLLKHRIVTGKKILSSDVKIVDKYSYQGTVEGIQFYWTATVQYRLRHEDDDSEEFFEGIASALTTDDKGSGHVESYAYKNAFLKCLHALTEGTEDPDRNDPDVNAGRKEKQKDTPQVETGPFYYALDKAAENVREQIAALAKKKGAEVFEELQAFRSLIEFPEKYEKLRISKQEFENREMFFLGASPALTAGQVAQDMAEVVNRNTAKREARAGA
jgi:hypothetical protein